MMRLLKKFRDLSMKIQLIVFFLAVGVIPPVNCSHSSGAALVIASPGCKIRGVR